MKIYCLLLDAFPYNDQFEKLAQEKGLTFLTQIGHSHTKPTITSMLTGRTPLDIMPKGVGYHSLEDHENFCEWRKDKNISLVDILKDKNYIVQNNNRNGMFCRDILGFSCEGVAINPNHVQALENGDYYFPLVEIEDYKYKLVTKQAHNNLSNILLKWIEENNKLIEAANKLNIKYSSAKTIISNYK